MQQTFSFDSRASYKDYNFIISECNICAFDSIFNYNQCFQRRMILIGESYSGKTHLSKIWCKKTGGVFVSDINIDDQYLKKTITNGPIAVDDLHLIKEEENLLYVINISIENKMPLLITGQSIPKFTIKDLASRIAASNTLFINKPDDFMIKALLTKHFSEKQLDVDSEIIEYICSRVERSFEGVYRLVNKIDNISLREKRNITIPFIKNVLQDSS